MKSMNIIKNYSRYINWDVFQWFFYKTIQQFSTLGCLGMSDVSVPLQPNDK